MSGYSLSRITEQLTERDYLLIADVTRYRLATTRQLQRLHFDHRHPSTIAAVRACTRNLTRLRDLGILKTLERRVGGARAGSAGLVWYLGPAGERIQNARENRTGRARRNYREPSPHFVEHTLAITDTAVTIHELARDHPAHLELLELQTEPTSWQTSLTNYGTTHTLKPDLRLVTAAGDYEHHWFLEVDRDTEHLPVIARQCAAYETHRATGRYQSEHDIYPTVVWIVPTTRRRTTIQNRIHADPKLDDRLFAVITAGQLPQLLLDQTEKPNVQGPADKPYAPTQKEGEQQ